LYDKLSIKTNWKIKAAIAIHEKNVNLTKSYDILERPQKRINQLLLDTPTIFYVSSFSQLPRSSCQDNETHGNVNEESPTTTTFLNMKIDGQTCNIRDQT
jgi:hypothetical protein